jgi:hypothetical protein
MSDNADKTTDLDDELEELIDGYSFGDIETVAEELFTAAVGMDIPSKLAMLGACRLVSLLAEDEEDLDKACAWIDELSEGENYETEEEADEEDGIVEGEVYDSTIEVDLDDDEDIN